MLLYFPLPLKISSWRTKISNTSNKNDNLSFILFLCSLIVWGYKNAYNTKLTSSSFYLFINQINLSKLFKSWCRFIWPILRIKRQAIIIKYILILRFPLGGLKITSVTSDLKYFQSGSCKIYFLKEISFRTILFLLLLLYFAFAIYFK